MVAPAPALLALLLLLPSSMAAASGLHFAAPYGNGMLLQRGQPLAVWGGGAEAGSEVTVTLLALPSSKPVVAKAAADPGGNWTARLPAVSTVAAAAVLTATDGGSTASLTGVAVGELLLCGGQSK